MTAVGIVLVAVLAGVLVVRSLRRAHRLIVEVQQDVYALECDLHPEPEASEDEWVAARFAEICAVLDLGDDSRWPS